MWISCVLLRRRTPGDHWICLCVIDPSSAHGMTMIITGEFVYMHNNFESVYMLYAIELVQILVLHS